MNVTGVAVFVLRFTNKWTRNKKRCVGGLLRIEQFEIIFVWFSWQIRIDYWMVLYCCWSSSANCRNEYATSFENLAAAYGCVISNCNTGKLISILECCSIFKIQISFQNFLTNKNLTKKLAKSKQNSKRV